MRLSDIIAGFIAAGLEEAEGMLEMSRGDLAERFGCVPSQINYVLTTRFTPEHGYLVETKRGGGGYIRITRVRRTPEGLIMHTVNAVGEELDARTAAAFLQNLSGTLPDDVLRVVAAAAGESALRMIPTEWRDTVRARIFKQCLMVTLI